MKSFLEHGIALYHAIVVNGYLYRLFAPDQDDKLFPPCHRSIYKVSLQKGIVCGMDGNDDAGEFRTLGFMHRDCIGQDYLPQV